MASLEPGTTTLLFRTARPTWEQKPGSAPGGSVIYICAQDPVWGVLEMLCSFLKSPVCIVVVMLVSLWASQRLGSTALHGPGTVVWAYRVGKHGLPELLYFCV